MLSESRKNRNLSPPRYHAVLKFTGLSFLSFSVAMIGFLLCDKMSERKKMLVSFQKLCNSAAVRIRCSGKDVISVIKESGSGNLGFLNDIDGSLLLDKNDTMAFILKNGADVRDAEDYSDFLIGLTANDLTGIENHCSVYSEKFGQSISALSQEITDKGRVLKTVSLFAAAAIFIILI